jgi:uncharacterized membrane protein
MTVRNTITRDVDGARMTAMSLNSIDPIDLERLRAELERERAARVQAEARARASEQRAIDMEERLTVAEWLVGVLRGELTGVEKDAPPSPVEPTPRRWWPFSRS